METIKLNVDVRTEPFTKPVFGKFKLKIRMSSYGVKRKYINKSKTL